MNPEHIEQALPESEWQVDGGFSAHLVVGHDGYDVSILAHNWVWEVEKPVFSSLAAMERTSPTG
jgi:hypothetical protein